MTSGLLNRARGYLAEVRKPERVLARRRRADFVLSALRSCAVCACVLPPIDLLCPVCWRELGSLVNRGESLRQSDYPFPVYSLFTWTPANDLFVRRLIYAFKGGRTVRACETLATLFLSERFSGVQPQVPNALITSDIRPHLPRSFFSAPSSKFDHSALWSTVLAHSFQQSSLSPFLDVTPAVIGHSSAKGVDSKGQKRLSQSERGHRRYTLKEEFAYLVLDSEEALAADRASKTEQRADAGPKRDPKHIVFADDVITSGATAMAAYMALGDPDGFEVWTLAARPRLATKSALR